MPESSFFRISGDGVLAPFVSLSEALSAEGGGFLWVDLYQPTRAELSALIDPFDLHPLSIEDCTDVNQVPKIEEFPHNTFLIFNSFSYADRKLAVDDLALFIGADFLISVSGWGSEERRPLGDIGHVVADNLDSARLGPAHLMQIVLDSVVDRKFEAIEALEDDMDKAEDAVVVEALVFDPAELLRLRRNLMLLRKSLFHEREILVKICRRDSSLIPEDVIFHYRDIYDHLSKSFELTEALRDLVTSLMEIYLSMLNNRMARAANETNVSVRRMTIVMTVFMPLTLLAGIGGMSEWSMMTRPENWRIAYPAFLLAMAVIGIANYYLLRRLERRST